MADMHELDMSTVAAFLKRYDMGVDDLFFVIHLGAKQLSHKAEMPAPQKEHWAKVSEDCYGLWHNTLRDGKPVT